ncbi:MAG: carboxymuconolactone decarboxylase family protein, partial [Pseudomonadota bacterium]
MPRLDPLSPEDAAELADLFDGVEDMMGFTPNDGLIMARKPAIARALTDLVRAIYAPGHVDPGLKRLIGEAASKAAGCVYCSAHAAFAADRHGVSREKIEAVWRYQDSPLFSAAERAAIQVAMRAAVT